MSVPSFFSFHFSRVPNWMQSFVRFSFYAVGTGKCVATMMRCARERHLHSRRTGLWVARQGVVLRFRFERQRKKQKKSRLSKRLISFHITRLAFPLLRPTDGLKKKKKGVALPDKRKRDGSNIGDQGRAFKNVRETGRWRIFVFDKKKISLKRRQMM